MNMFMNASGISVKSIMCPAPWKLGILDYVGHPTFLFLFRLLATPSQPNTHPPTNPKQNTPVTANMVAQSPEFKKAQEDSRSLTQTPSNDELLEVRKDEVHVLVEEDHR